MERDARLTRPAMNWTGYIDYWDNFILKWIKDPISLAQNDPLICSLVDVDEIIDLPEPYYCGVPLDSELDAVLINLNPGKSSVNEWVKFHCFLDNPKAYVSYELAHCGKSYYNNINKKFNPLLKATRCDVPGKLWWEKRRLKWLDDFFPLGGRNVHNGYRPERLYVIEFSPWHSLSNNLHQFKSLCAPLREHISSFVIDPLADAINRSRLLGGQSGKPYGLCFSKAVYDVLTRHYSFIKLEQWDSNTPSIASIWPNNANKRAISRTYALIEGYGSKGQSFRLLCLWYNNIGVNAPSNSFQLVEQYIKSKI